MAKLNIGVIIGRFHIHEPHEGHRHLFEHALKHNDRVCILLGCSVLDGHASSKELSFTQRHAILTQAVPGAIILRLNDRPSDADWSNQVDHLVKSTFPDAGKITLYGGRKSFIDSYKGTFPVENVQFIPIIDQSATNVRAAIKETNTADFFRGQIYGIQSQYPHAYMAADVALVRNVTTGGDMPRSNLQVAIEDHMEVFLIQRTDSGNWCFPGGFVDPEKDANAQAGAARELHEETGLYSETPLKMIYEGQVNDWRFRGVPDKVYTILFMGQFAFGAPVINRDEVNDYQWARAEKALTIISAAHRPLLEALIAHGLPVNAKI